MRDLYLLIKPRFSGFKNQLIRTESKARKKILFTAVLGFAFSVGMFVLSCRVLAHFQNTEMMGDFLARYLLSMIFLTFFSLLIFSHIVTALSNLYLSKDLEFCHSTPTAIEGVFVSRAIYTFLDSSWMLIVFGLPIFVAYAYVYDAEPVFYFHLFHLNVAMALMAAGMGILITMILVHVFPAQRTRDLILLLSVLLIVVLYLLFRFLRPERLVDPESFFSVVQYLNAMRAPKSPYLPTQWISETLWDALKGTPAGNSAFQIALTWTTAGALWVINIWMARVIYFKGFSKTQESKRRRKGGGKLLGLVVRSFTKFYGRETGGVLAKDLRTFLRDNSQWSQVLLLGALVVVYLYNFKVLPMDRAPVRLDFLQNTLAFLNLGLAGFVLSAVSARFIYTAVSAEGEAYWIVRSSPMGPGTYLWGKYMFFLFPMLLLAEVLIVVTDYLLHVTPFMMALSAGTMFIMVFGIVALGVGLGALYPNFTHQNIAQVATGFGGVLYMIISSLFVAVLVVLEAGPVYIVFVAEVRGQTVSLFQWIYVLSSFAAVLAAALLATIKPMKMGIKALREYER